MAIKTHIIGFGNDRWEESNGIEISTQTRYRLQKHFGNKRGQKTSQSNQCIICSVHCIGRFVWCVRRHVSIAVQPAIRSRISYIYS
eukprot:scaffold61393_cov59-Cyclotella_meneghiniana.AAC.4